MTDPHWRGVFPAVTTQMTRDGSIDLPATAAHVDALIDSGVAGLVVLGSLGENQSLLPGEKRQTVKYLAAHVRGRVPILSGVAETTTAAAAAYAVDCAALGADGLMLMPPMLYRGDPAETVAHFRAVATASPLPVMLYNNPISYANDLTPPMLAELADLPNVVALKESAGDTRRITDLHNAVGGRFAIFTGVDDLMLESAIVGIDGWVAGSGIAFPAENQHLWDLTRRGDWAAAVAVYRWFTPLLHLDVSPKFVQYIKLAVQACGLGREWVRPPRLPLVGDERERVLQVIRTGMANRPQIGRAI